VGFGPSVPRGALAASSLNALDESGLLENTVSITDAVS
jgi:hypothetical protein